MFVTVWSGCVSAEFSGVLACMEQHESWDKSCSNAEVLASLLPQFAGARAYDFHFCKELLGVLIFFFNPSICQVPNSTGHLKMISFSVTHRECYSIVLFLLFWKKLTCLKWEMRQTVKLRWRNRTRCTCVPSLSSMLIFLECKNYCISCIWLDDAKRMQFA